MSRRLLLFLFDFIFLNVSLSLPIVFLPSAQRSSHHDIELIYVTSNVLWFVIILLKRFYQDFLQLRFEQELQRVIKSWLIHAIIVIGFYYYHDFKLLTPKFLWLYAPSFLTLLISGRFLFIYLNHTIYSKKTINYITLGASNNIFDFELNMKGEWSANYKRLERFFYNPKVDFLDDLERLMSFIENNQIDEIYCDSATIRELSIGNFIEVTQKNFIQLFVIPATEDYFPRGAEFSSHNGIGVFRMKREHIQKLRHRISKRIFDIIFSLSVILFIYPFLFPIISLLIKLESSGSIFFKQVRSGYQGGDFTCYKFRSMGVNKDSHKVQATIGDVRVTKIGAFLRKTSLDEFPQFINVLQGRMSVVGPRPHMLAHTDEYKELIGKYMLRHLVKPGITGWAQVNGYRGPTAELKQMKKRVEHDVWYIENWSMGLDLKIIFLTVYNAIKGEENAL